MKQDLLAWNGKDADYLRDLYARAFDWNEAIALLDDPHVAVGASWLIKHRVERARITGEQVQQLLDAQRSDGAWETVLHLVQALDKVDVSGCDAEHALYILYKTKDHSGHFVRAWSLSAIARIAQAQPRFRDDAKDVISAAFLAEEKPSVIARLKKAARYLDQS